VKKRKCKICGWKGCNLGCHVLFLHKISNKNYYDTYLKKEKEGFCLHCGIKTKFLDIGKGYKKYCNRTCMFGSENFRKKQSDAKKGKKLSEETKQKIGNGNRGKTLSEETKCKIGKASKGRVHSEEAKCKNAEAHQGKIVSQETREKISKIHKGKIVSQETREKISKIHKGKRLCEKTKRKISVAKKGQIMSSEAREKIRLAGIGRVVSQKTKDRISRANKGRFIGKKLSEKTKDKIRKAGIGRICSEETRKKISNAHRGRGHKQTAETREKIGRSSKGRIVSGETRRKKRISKIRELERKYSKYGSKFIIRGEKEIDCIDNYLKFICPYEIDIGFKIAGYFVDAYIHNINLVIEFDEKHHEKPCQRIKDKVRQKNIENELKCKFFRIKESQWNNNRDKVISDFKKIISMTI